MEAAASQNFEVPHVEAVAAHTLYNNPAPGIIYSVPHNADEITYLALLHSLGKCPRSVFHFYIDLFCDEYTHTKLLDLISTQHNTTKTSCLRLTFILWD